MHLPFLPSHCPNHFRQPLQWSTRYRPSFMYIWSNLIRRCMLLHKGVYQQTRVFTRYGLNQGDTVLITGHLSFSDVRPVFFTGAGLIMGTVLYSGYHGIMFTY